MDGLRKNILYMYMYMYARAYACMLCVCVCVCVRARAHARVVHICVYYLSYFFVLNRHLWKRNWKISYCARYV